MKHSKFYAIRATHYMQGSRDVCRFVEDETYEPKIFEGREAAKAWIEATESEGCYLGCNEICRPNYRILLAARVDNYRNRLGNPPPPFTPDDCEYYSGYAKKYG